MGCTRSLSSPETTASIIARALATVPSRSSRLLARSFDCDLGMCPAVVFSPAGQPGCERPRHWITHAIFAAWCHQAQHEDPRLVRWLSRTPIHFVHHTLNQTRHNFGISVDWWDHVFGTYEPEPELSALLEPNYPYAHGGKSTGSTVIISAALICPKTNSQQQSSPGRLKCEM